MRKQIVQTPHTSLNLLLKVNELEVEHEIAIFRNCFGDPGLVSRQMNRRHVLGVEEANLRGEGVRILPRHFNHRKRKDTLQVHVYIRRGGNWRYR